MAAPTATQGLSLWEAMISTSNRAALPPAVEHQALLLTPSACGRVIGSPKGTGRPRSPWRREPQSCCSRLWTWHRQWTKFSMPLAHPCWGDRRKVCLMELLQWHAPWEWAVTGCGEGSATVQVWLWPQLSSQANKGAKMQNPRLGVIKLVTNRRWRWKAEDGDKGKFGYEYSDDSARGTPHFTNSKLSLFSTLFNFFRYASLSFLSKCSLFSSYSELYFSFSHNILKDDSAAQFSREQKHTVEMFFFLHGCIFFLSLQSNSE